MEQKALSQDQAKFTGSPKSVHLEDGSLVHYLRSLYKLEMHRLKMRHLNGADGAEITACRSALVDILLRLVSRRALSNFQSHDSYNKNAIRSITWIALGEYGSQELAPFSPVELLILGKPALKFDPGSGLKKVLEVLHSIGFEVNVSLLAPKECLQRAQNDFSFCFSLLSARCVAGEETAFQDFFPRFRSGLFKNRLVYIYELAKLLDYQHQEHGDSVYLLESNVESGTGGVLDYRALLSSIKLLSGRESPEKTLMEGEISPLDWQRILVARQHLLRVRNHLHFLCGKRQDVLSQGLMEQVAEFFGYRNSRYQRRTEIFLRDTLRRRKHIEATLVRSLDRAKARLSRGPENFTKPYLKLALTSPENEEEQTPERWMKIFHFSQTQPMLLNEQLKSSIRSNLYKWDARSFNTPSLHEDFRLIMKNKGKVGGALRVMRDLGFLGRYLPEFGRLDCLVQVDRAHKYSIDELTLGAIETLDEVASSTNPALQDYKRVLEQVSDPSLIYFALVLHDTGKGLGEGHATQSERLTARALHRLNFDAESREKVLLLVREHLLLGHVSQRRDIDDPLIVQEVSGTVETADNLNMLLLMTYADLRSMGESVWSERKDSLLWSLYFKIFDCLMFGDEISQPEYARVAAIQQEVLEKLGREFDMDTILKHFSFLPEKYALYTAVPQILSHIRLCERLRDYPVVTEWIPHPHAGYAELVVSTRDLPGRFAQIAGSLAAHGISILSAQLNTRDDGIVIDTFQVSDHAGKAVFDSESWSRVDQLLSEVIRGEKSVDVLLESRLRDPSIRQTRSSMIPRVRIDNEISSQSSVIEVQTEDRLGLGYLIARTLADLGLNILSAKLATERNYAFDVFYVQTREGEKVTNSSQMTEILERLRFQLNA